MTSSLDTNPIHALRLLVQAEDAPAQLVLDRDVLRALFRAYDGLAQSYAERDGAIQSLGAQHVADLDARRAAVRAELEDVWARVDAALSQGRL